MPSQNSQLLKESLSGQVALLNEMLSLCLEPHVRSQGISMGAFEIMSAIHATGGKAPQAEIARHLGIRPPSLCESLKALSAADLVLQVPHSRDHRVKTLKLTTRGASVLRNVLKAVAENEIAMLRGIEPDAIRQAVGTIAQANKNLAQVLKS